MTFMTIFLGLLALVIFLLAIGAIIAGGCIVFLPNNHPINQNLKKMANRK